MMASCINGEPNWDQPLSLRPNHFQKLLEKFGISLRIMNQFNDVMGLGALAVDKTPDSRRYGT